MPGTWSVNHFPLCMLLQRAVQGQGSYPKPDVIRDDPRNGGYSYFAANFRRWLIDKANKEQHEPPPSFTA